jgi:hypothetical protein
LLSWHVGFKVMAVHLSAGGNVAPLFW